MSKKPTTIGYQVSQATAERLADIAAKGDHERQLVELEVGRRINRFARKFTSLGLEAKAASGERLRL